MSLFQCREWWSHNLDKPEECDKGCMIVADIDNSGDSTNLKVVVGTFKGMLRIYAPRKRGFNATDIRLEQDLGAPVLQLAAGKFIQSSDELALAVLHPRTLAVYAVRGTAGGFTEKRTKDDVFYTLDQIYIHRLSRTACNMCYGPFGGSRKGGSFMGGGQKGDSICVQSMDGQIFVMEQENFAFARFLNNFLLPGPIAYIQEIDSIVTVNSQMQVECYRYRTLGTTMGGREKGHGSEKAGVISEEGPGSMSFGKDVDRVGLRSSRTKIQTAWATHLGEHSLDLATIRMAPKSSLGPASPPSATSSRDLVILGENTLFTVDNQGKMLSQRRFGFSPACFAGVPIGEAGEDGKEGAVQKWHVAIATAHNTIMVYNEKKLLWAAQTPFVPVAMHVGAIGGTRGMVCMLSDEGHVSITYLGTDPISNITAVPETRELDYESMDREHKALLKVIRNSVNSQLQEPSDKLSITCQVPHVPLLSHDYRLDDEDVAVNAQGVPVVIVVKFVVSYLGEGEAKNGTLSLSVPEAVKIDSNTIHLPEIKGQSGNRPGTPQVIEVPFFVSKSVLPSSSKIEGVASYVTTKGAPRTTWVHFSLPLCLLCRVVAPVNVANFAINIDSNVPSPPLSTLFGEIFKPAVVEQPELNEHGDKVISLNFYAGPIVTVRLSKTKTKIRFQSVSFESLWLVTNQYVRRLHSYHAKARKGDRKEGSADDPGDLALKFTDMLPLKQYFELIDNHFNVRLQIMTIQHALETAASQFRAVQKRLLVRYRHKNPSDLMDLDLLLHESFMRLNTLSDRMQGYTSQLRSACSNLSCGTHLLLLLIRFKFGLDSKNAYLMEAFLSPVVAHDTDSQGWEERTKAAMLHLLRSVLVKNGRGQKVTQFQPSQMTLMPDTSKLKANIQLVCERLAKGYRLYKTTSKKKDSSKAMD